MQKGGPSFPASERTEAGAGGRPLFGSGRGTGRGDRRTSPDPVQTAEHQQAEEIQAVVVAENFLISGIDKYIGIRYNQLTLYRRPI